jgi:hypothetical protein
MVFYTLLRRAVVSNLRSISASDCERARLEATGICEPTVQRYLAWRRSMVVMVLLATVLSAALATFRALTEFDERTLFSAMTEHFLANAKQTAT